MKIPRNPFLLGFLQAAALVLYIVLFVTVVTKSGRFEVLGEQITGTIVLFSFCFSALVCSVITFGYPVIALFVDKKWKHAMQVLLCMILWLAIVGATAFFFVSQLSYRPLLD